MKHAKEADRGAEMLGIASDWEEGFGTLNYLFCRQDCEIDFLRSWKYLDVSELRGTVIHTAVGKTKAF